MNDVSVNQWQHGRKLIWTYSKVVLAGDSEERRPWADNSLMDLILFIATRNFKV